MAKRLVSTPGRQPPWGLLLAVLAMVGLSCAAGAVWAFLVSEPVAAAVLAGAFVLMLGSFAWVSHFKSVAQRQRITVAFDERLFIFENFWVHDSFWPKPPRPRMNCPFDDVMSVYWMPNPSGCGALIVVTRHGTLYVHSWFTNFAVVRDALTQAASRSRSRASFLRSPWVLLALGCASGAFLVWIAYAMEWV